MGGALLPVGYLAVHQGKAFKRTSVSNCEQHGPSYQSVCEKQISNSCYITSSAIVNVPFQSNFLLSPRLANGALRLFSYCSPGLGLAEGQSKC